MRTPSFQETIDDLASGKRHLTVTSPLLPSLAEIMPYIARILDSGWVTNGGSCHAALEKALTDRLAVKELSLVTNATVGLDLAVKATVTEGEVITTAYSFPATYHALLNHAGIKPVFCDIDQRYCLDPSEVEKHITKHTRAILAVHTYGYPCQIERLEQIAKEYNLFLIFDAAPAFGETYKGRGIGSFGDLSVFSFHATKVFNTLEGGCITCGDSSMVDAATIRLLRNFGIVNEEEVALYGMNGKMDEVRAAFGLATLPLLESALQARKEIVFRYLELFKQIAIPEVETHQDVYTSSEFNLNYSYFPVLISPVGQFNRNTVYQAMRSRGIFARRYFYPTIVNSPIYNGLYNAAELRHTLEASLNILCLPLHHKMSNSDCEMVVDCLQECYRQR